jgi:hypothetical protein
MLQWAVVGFTGAGKKADVMVEKKVLTSGLLATKCW